MTVKREYFDYCSDLHGIQHTYRVMVLAHRLGTVLNKIRERDLAIKAAFIHDMARRDDGRDIFHGLRACKTKIHLLEGTKRELREIQTAVYNHCEPKDIKPGHPHYVTAMILKDADLLDRVRMDKEIDWRRARFTETRQLEGYARTLLKITFDGDIFKDTVSRHQES